MKSIIWQTEIGTEPDGYRLTCYRDEDLETDITTIEVVENGQRLAIREFKDDPNDPESWQQPFAFAELMRLRYFGHAMEKIRPFYQRRVRS